MFLTSDHILILFWWMISVWKTNVGLWQDEDGPLIQLDQTGSP